MENALAHSTLDLDAINDRLERTRGYAAGQDISKNIAAAQLAHSIVDELARLLVPGVYESEIKEYALQCFARHGIEKLWHPPYIRFGENTLLTFLDKAVEDKILGDEDIAYIDIGIVKDGIEGDAGKTVVMGRNPLFRELERASKTLFDQAVAYWKTAQPTGIELYDFIHEQAALAGWQFCLDPAGHLIGEFPHKGWKKGINNFPERIEAGKWILEIQIRHPQQPFGAFYENLLY